MITVSGDMSADESDNAGDTSARIVLSKLLADSDDFYTSTEYSWLVDMVNYTLYDQVVEVGITGIYLLGVLSKLLYLFFL